MAIMKSAQTATLVAILCLGPVIVGCQEPLQPTQPTVARVTVDPPERYGELWETVGDVLREHFFQLDRRDRQAGLITTFPETTANGFELWRPQPNDPYYWWEANVHTVQRQVTVKLSSTGEASYYDLDVLVERLRHRVEERQITNSAAALRLYSGDTPTFGGEPDGPSETSRWIPIGRDGPMEQRLLTTILDRFGADIPENDEPEASIEASPPTDAADTPEPGNRDNRGFTVPIPN
jgi:hypothetical protein